MNATTLGQRSALSASNARTNLLRAGLVVGFAGLTAICAQVSFPIPGTPVPVTLQTLAVTLAAITLGGRLGALSMGLYWALGIIGLPVYADGLGGVQVAVGATLGYLAGFVVAQPAMAWAMRGRDGAYAGWRGVLASLAIGHAVIFTLGVSWLMLSQKLALATALDQGLWPFIPGSVVKGAAAMLLGVGIAPWASKRVW